MYHVKLVAELKQTPEEEQVVPHVVQLISPPFLGRTVLTAGPAKFGMDLTKREHGVSLGPDGIFERASEAAVTRPPLAPQLKGSVLKASPYTACGQIVNAEEVRGHIALALRGDCMFAAKARRLQEAGAVGVIFIGEHVDPQSLGATQG